MQRPCPTDPNIKILRGPRGGYYYLSSTGNKIYCNPVTLKPVSPIYQAQPIVQQPVPYGAIPVPAAPRRPVPPQRTILYGRPLGQTKPISPRPPLPPIPSQRTPVPPAPPTPLPRAPFGYFQKLPADIRRTVLPTVLSYESLINLCQTSREYRQLCANRQTWLALLQKDFNWQPTSDFLSILAPAPGAGEISNERIIYEFLRRYRWSGDQLTAFIQELAQRLNKPVNLLSIYQKLPLLSSVGRGGQYTAPEVRAAFIARIFEDNVTRDFALNALSRLHDQPNLSALNIDENLEIIYVNETRTKYAFVKGRKRFEITFNNNGEIESLFVFDRYSKAQNNEFFIRTRDPNAVTKILPLAAAFLNSRVEPNNLIQTVVSTLGLKGPVYNGWQSDDGLTTASLA